MANEFKVKNGLIVDQGGATITGSVIATGGFTGSLFGTASYATQALSSSYALTASFALNGGGGATFPYVGTAVITGSLIVSGSNTSITTLATNTAEIIALNQVQMYTTRVVIGDNTGPPETIFLRSNTSDGGLFWTENDEMIAQYTAYDRYNYGNGNMYVSASDQKTYSPAGFVGPLTGSLFGTASYALTASYAMNGGGGGGGDTTAVEAQFYFLM